MPGSHSGLFEAGMVRTYISRHRNFLKEDTYPIALQAKETRDAAKDHMRKHCESEDQCGTMQGRASPGKVRQTDQYGLV